MRRFSPDLIEQVRLANDIVDLIGEDTFLKKSGEQRFVGLCPFPSHQEKTPSFSVSSAKQLYHCFGCGESGTLYTYLQTRRGLSFPESVKFLAQRAGIPLPHEDKKQDTQYADHRKGIEINQKALQWYKNCLNKLEASHRVKAFFHKRGFKPATVKEFHLGYAPQGWEGLCQHLQKQGCSLKMAALLGLVKEKENGRFYDVFRDRVMFPIFSRNGKDVIGFGGRTVSEAQKQSPKYINSADSQIFHKGKTFYGLHLSGAFMREQGKALVVEGYTDLISLYQAGVKNVVAPLGTALTADQVQKLSWYVEEVILFFDGDEAGSKAMDRSLSLLLARGLVPKRLKLEPGYDPDSFVRKQGAKALKQKLANAEDLFLHHLHKEVGKTHSDWDRFMLLEKISTLLAQTRKEALKDYYIQRVLDIFGSDAGIAQKALKKALQKNKILNLKTSTHLKIFTPPSKGEKDTSVSLPEAPKPELYLLVLSLQGADLYLQVKKSGVLSHMSHQGIKKLFDLLGEFDSLTNPRYFGVQVEKLTSFVQQPRLLSKEYHPLLRHLNPKQINIFIKDCVDKIEKRGKQLKIKNLTRQLRRGENEKQHLKEILKLVQKK